MKVRGRCSCSMSQPVARTAPTNFNMHEQFLERFHSLFLTLVARIQPEKLWIWDDLDLKFQVATVHIA